MNNTLEDIMAKIPLGKVKVPGLESLLTEDEAKIYEFFCYISFNVTLYEIEVEQAKIGRINEERAVLIQLALMMMDERYTWANTKKNLELIIAQ